MKKSHNHIHRKSKNLLEKEFSKAVKILTGFKYPKMLVLVLMIFISYYLFSSPYVSSKISSLHGLSYFGFLIAGLLFSFGFSAPLAVGFFIVAVPENIFLAAFAGGIGSLISDYIILKSIRFSFLDEFHRLQKLKIIRGAEHLLQKSFRRKIRNYLTYIFAGIIIASPLPDEIGVSMLAGMTKISERVFVVLDCALNTLGILIILLLASV